MSTPVKKDESIKVTTGKDFVAVKPIAADAPEQKAPESTGKLTAEDEAKHKQRLADLEKEFEAKKAEIAAKEQEMLAQAKERAAELEGAMIGEAKKNALAEAEKVFVNRLESLTDHPTNSRGAPIPVEDQPARVRHISEIGDRYNGKEDTIEDIV